MGGQLALNTNIECVARSMGCLVKGVLLYRRNDMDIQGCWAAPTPDGEKDVGMSREGVMQAPHLQLHGKERGLLTGQLRTGRP